MTTVEQRIYEPVVTSMLRASDRASEPTHRIEDKFLVRKTQRQELLSALGQHLKPAYPVPGTRFTEIESVYYDSPSLDIYNNHFLSKNSRFKVRSRKYAPNGFWVNDRAHLELKTKDDGVSKKLRFQMGANELKTLQKGLPIRLSKSVALLNPEIKVRALEKRLSKLNDIIRKNSLIPTCRVTYTRYSFENEQIRITVDDQIHSELLAKQTVAYARARRAKFPPSLLEEARTMLDKFSRDDYLVVEVKHRGEIPAWLTHFFAQSQSDKVSFSKYCYSMTRYLLSN